MERRNARRRKKSAHQNLTANPFVYKLRVPTEQTDKQRTRNIVQSIMRDSVRSWTSEKIALFARVELIPVELGVD